MGRGGMGLFSITSMAIAAFVVYIVLGSTPTGRMARACKPVPWAQNITVSILELLNASRSVPATSDWFASANYGCEFTLWRLFYQSDFNKAHKAQIASNTTPIPPNVRGGQ